MSDLPRSLFNDIANSNQMLARLLANSAAALPIDEFADAYRQVIADHLERGGYPIDPEDSYQLAADIWGYLRRGE